MNIKITHDDVTNNTRVRSSAVWFPYNDGAVDRSLEGGRHFFEDFVTKGLVFAVNSTAITAFGANTAQLWGCFTPNTAGCEVSTRVSEPTGVIRLAHAATDDTECHLQVGPNLANSGWFRCTDADGLLCFEERVRVGTVAASNMFVGIGMPNRAVADGVIGDTADATVAGLTSAVGFLKTAAGLWRPCYKTGSGTAWTFVGPGVAASTDWTKLGFRWNHQSGNPSRGLEFFVDGILLPDAVSVPDIQSATDLIAAHMTPMTVIKATAATANTLDVDWIGAGQYDLA